MVFAFQLYLLTDYIGMPIAEANATMVPLSLAGMVTTVIAVLVSPAGGATASAAARSSSTRRRAVMVAGLVLPLLMPSVTGMLIMAVINGFGFGLYMACDTALMTQVLPGGGTAAGKDLGILNVATNIPQAMSPAIAGLLIGSLGGYPALFVFGIVCVIAAAFVLVPIKSVR